MTLAADNHEPLCNTAHWQLALMACMMLGLLLMNPIAFGAENFAFVQHDVDTGPGARQSVLTGFLLNGAIADIGTVNVDKNNGRHLHIHTFRDGSWALNIDTSLRPQVSFIDMANLGGHDRLITYEPGRVSWFDPASKTEHELVFTTSNFNSPRNDEILHVDITRDVNGDGRDDLVVPDSDGFRVFIQSDDGTFAEPVTVGPPADLSGIYGSDGFRYDPWSHSRVHKIDYNRDGRIDLVFWSEDHFDVHLQDERGRFAATPEIFTVKVAFDSHRMDSLAAGDMTGKALHSLADMNDDAIADLVVFSLEGGKVPPKKSSCEVHFGKPTANGGIIFNKDADLVFQSDEKIYLDMKRHDFDGDGQVDVMLTTIAKEYLTGSLWKELKGFMGDDVWLNSGVLPNGCGSVSRKAERHS